MYINPYENINESGKWYRSNFHAHAGTGEGTCGAYEINEVVSLYKEAGYDLLTISNHDLYSDVSDFQNKHDIVLINGFEYSQDHHMLCVGVEELIEAKHQKVIEKTCKQGGFVILCHPNWKNWKKKRYWPWEEIDNITGYSGIEIFNSLIFRLEGNGLATDTWDYLLSQGKLIWGFANDDFHRWYDLAKAWNMIYSSTADHQSLVNSIQKGNFYASTGLSLYDFKLNNDEIYIKAGAKNSHIEKYKYKFIGKNGKVLKEKTGKKAKYHISGDELYIRIKVISEHGAMLWTQPVYRKESFK